MRRLTSGVHTAFVVLDGRDTGTALGLRLCLRGVSTVTEALTATGAARWRAAGWSVR